MEKEKTTMYAVVYAYIGGAETLGDIREYASVKCLAVEESAKKAEDLAKVDAEKERLSLADLCETDNTRIVREGTGRYIIYADGELYSLIEISAVDVEL